MKQRNIILSNPPQLLITDQVHIHKLSQSNETYKYETISISPLFTAEESNFCASANVYCALVSSLIILQLINTARSFCMSAIIYLTHRI